jgi:hypothetical protein
VENMQKGPSAGASRLDAVQAAVDWDGRLDALKVSLAPAAVANGKTYWRLVRAAYEAASGRSVIYCEVLDENGVRVLGQKLTLTWPGGSGQTTTENKPAPEMAANFPIAASYNPEHGPGAYDVGVDGLSSDVVKGMGKPKGADACFYLMWQRATAGQAPARSIIRGMVIGGQAGQTVTLRPASGAARQAALDGAGAFSFSGLPAGVYVLEVAGVTVPGLRVDGASALDVPAIDIRPRQSIIKGLVLRATGEPAGGVKVILTMAAVRQETVTDGNGAYQFSGLLSGAYALEAAGLTQTARVTGRDQVTVDFRLPPEPARKPISLYVLFGSPQQLGTRSNLVLAEDYLLKVGATAGFCVDEAAEAAAVVIVGDVQAVSVEDEEQLKGKGCQVTRLGGGPYAIEQAFADLMKGRGLSPAPAERLRGPRAGKGRDEGAPA